MHDTDLSRHNYYEHNNNKLRALRMMLGNRWAWVWFAHTHTMDIYFDYEQATLYDK